LFAERIFIGKSCRAKASLKIKTRGDSEWSRSLKARPARSGMPIARK